ncbi:hypothetical protein N7510_009287 [Penicillium lagena]|uniref:uncharacterized protein n=1 Tax=Penicillium lagena TaxID=94218 RepID=UPI002541572E|nr:uncharacterized protein N7510_009287 [Penicillium lagena]KAJ5606506.1 hypothetical protein N7510_009287 [Penicillium lagena]
MFAMDSGARSDKDFAGVRDKGNDSMVLMTEHPKKTAFPCLSSSNLRVSSKDHKPMAMAMRTTWSLSGYAAVQSSRPIHVHRNQKEKCLNMSMLIVLFFGWNQVSGYGIVLFRNGGTRGIVQDMTGGHTMVVTIIPLLSMARPKTVGMHGKVAIWNSFISREVIENCDAVMKESGWRADSNKARRVVC